MGLWKLWWKFMTKLPKIVRNTYNAIYHSVYGVSSWVCPGLGFRVRVFALNRVCPFVCPSIRPSNILLARRLFNVWLDERAEGRWVLSHFHPWGTHWELKNPLGTWREHRGNKGKMKKILPPPPPPVEGRNLGKGGRGGMRNGGCGNSRILKTPIKIGHLLGV